MILTKHFNDRLFERFGIVLSENEIFKLIKGIKKTHQGIDFKDGEEFIITLHHRHVRFVAVIQDGKLVTAHPGKPMSRKRFLKKCNLGIIKNN
jgi:hypothetical protein